MDMAILTTPSTAFSTSLIYITVGALIDIWTIVSLVFYPPSSEWGHFLVVGFLVTGVALLIIGLLLGPIGRAARHAELPPTEVTAAVVQAEQTAAAHPPVVVPLSPAQQVGIAAGAQPIVAPTLAATNTQAAHALQR
jgi:hypothetical protein